MERVFQKITHSLVENGNINREYEAVYQYALQSVLILGLNILLSFLIGILLHKLGYCLLFLGAIILLRSDAGGYHAPNVVVCYLLSFLVLISSLLLVDRLNGPQAAALGTAAVISAAFLFQFAPLESENKPLSEIDRVVNKKRTRWLVSLELLAGFLLLAADPVAAYTMWAVIVWSGIGYLAWFIEKRWKAGAGDRES